MATDVQVAARKVVSLNPATGETLRELACASEQEVHTAVARARGAQPSWLALDIRARIAVLNQFQHLLHEKKSDVARLITNEAGKPYVEALTTEVMVVLDAARFLIENAYRLLRDEPLPHGNLAMKMKAGRILREPYGVIGIVSPWNYPFSIPATESLAALVAGNAIVIKPSELTPYTALALVKLAEEAGFPAGVINMLTGNATAIGGVMTSSPVVRKLSFTGSTRVGSLLMRQSADTIKRLSLELGGNAPLIVFDDADLDLAVASTMASKFRNAGQTCVCANRILVQDGVYDAFAEKLARAVSALKVAPGDQPGSTIGPLINAAAVDKVKAHVEDALSHGAKILAQAPEGATGERFATPVVLTGATREMRLAEEETFGPVAPLFRFTHEEEGIDLANATSYGLASYFYTENLHRAFRVAERLEAGMVALNTGAISMEMAPFGGVKMSGLGREGAHLGIEEYLETKAFHVGGLKL